MRILIISTFFPPLNSVASLRPYSWAKYWTAAGHDVTVLTTQKKNNPLFDLKWDNPGFEVIDPPLPGFAYTLKEKNQQTEGAGSFVQRIRRKYGIFHSCRMPDLTDLWIRPAIKAAKKRKPWDLIVSSSGPYSVNCVAWSLKRQGMAPRWIGDFRDRWSDHHIFPGLFPFNRVEKALEYWLMKRVDAIVTVSDPYAESFRKKYGKEKVFVVENGFDPEEMQSIPQVPVFLKDDKVRLVYTGSFFCRKQDPEPLFSAIAHLSSLPETRKLLDLLEVLFVGPEQLHLRSLIDSYQIGPWVKCLGFVNRETSLRMQRDADALLFFPWGDTSVEGVLTGKLFEYLFSGTPILSIGATQQKAAQHLIERTGRGKILATEENCRNTLLAFLNREGEQIRLVPQDPLILAPYHRKHLAEKLLEIANPW